MLRDYRLQPSYNTAMIGNDNAIDNAAKLYYIFLSYSIHYKVKYKQNQLAIAQKSIVDAIGVWQLAIGSNEWVTGNGNGNGAAYHNLKLTM